MSKKLTSAAKLQRERRLYEKRLAKKRRKPLPEVVKWASSNQ